MSNGKNGRTCRRSRRLAPVVVGSLAVALICWLAAAPVRAAETRLFTLEIPENRAVTYELPLEVRHPGLLTVRAEWGCERKLSFRLDHPDKTVAAVHKAGSSPQSIELEVAPPRGETANLVLTIHAARGAGSGEALLTVLLPDPRPEKPSPAAPAPPPIPPRKPDPWMVPRAVEPGSPPDRQALFRNVEEFRSAVERAKSQNVADACRWQDGLMRYLAARRDAEAGSGALPAPATLRMLLRIADSIHDVDLLRTSADPLIAGPPPAERERREMWERLRRESFRAVERRLDEILESLERSHAPELDAETWPARMITCLAACERHFEERVRVGEDQAINLDLARIQWDPMLRAAGALRALAGPDRQAARESR